MTTVVTLGDGGRVVVGSGNGRIVAGGGMGVQGKPGIGIQLLGTYATLGALQAAHPTGTVGDVYAVAGDLYVWDAEETAWANAGTFRGPPGDSDGITQEEADVRYVRLSQVNAANGVAGLDADGVLIASISYNSTNW